MRICTTALTLGWGVHQHTVSFLCSIGFLIDHLFDTDTLLVDTGSSNTWVGANKAYKTTNTSVDTGNTFVSICGVYSFFIIPTAFSIFNTAQLANHRRLERNTWTQWRSTLIWLSKINLLALAHLDSMPGYLAHLMESWAWDRLTWHRASSAIQMRSRLWWTTFIRRGQSVLKYSEYSSHLPPAVMALASSHSAVMTRPKSREKSVMCLSHQHIHRVDPGALINPSATGAQRFWARQLVSLTLVLLLFWLPLVSALYGNEIVLIHCSDAFDKYQSATGATLDQNTGYLMISSDQYANLSSLYFNIGGVSYELTPNAQIWPRSLNSDIGGTSDGIYLIVRDSGSNSGSGLDFVNGHGFLYAVCFITQAVDWSTPRQRFYAVLDTTNSQVGFATTVYTDATSN